MSALSRIAGLLIACAVAAAAPEVAFAQKNACKDVPIRWFVYPSADAGGGSIVPAALRGDGDWYSAANGNSNVVIHVCGDNASGDATIAVGSKRRMLVDLSGSIAGSGTAVAPGPHASSPFINVRNLVFDRVHPFTTRMSINLPQLTAGQEYRLHFMPLVADTSLRRYDDITVNSPSDTSVVVVEPQAYDCDIRAGGTLPAWIVRGVQDNGGGAMQVATLTQNTNKGALHRGQYQLPFEIRIEATSCMAR